MAAIQPSKNAEFEKALRLLEEQAQQLTEESKNLIKSWQRGDRDWVPRYLLHKMKETEEKVIQIKSLIHVQRDITTGDEAVSGMVPGVCKEHMERIEQLKRNNETLLHAKQKLENDFNYLKCKVEKESPSVLTSVQIGKHKKSDLCKTPQTLSEDDRKMIDLETNLNNEKAALRKENDKLLEDIRRLNLRIKELEEESSDFRERLSASGQRPHSEAKKTGTKKYDKQPEAMENTMRNETDANKVSNEISIEKKNGTENKSCNTARDVTKNLSNLKNETNNHLEENQALKSKDDADKRTVDVERQDQRVQNEEKKTSSPLPSNHEKHNGNACVEEKWKNKFCEIEKDKRRLLNDTNMLREQNEFLKAYNKQLIEEKDELLLRLSKFAGSKLVENNPAITDLSDPHRPTKLAEYYSELYDNEWTDAFDALKTAGYEETKAVEILLHTLENVLQFCEAKAELLLRQCSDAVNLLFKEYKQSVLQMAVPVHVTLHRQNPVENHLQRVLFSQDDFKLQQMWRPKDQKKWQKLNPSKVHETENIKVEAENKLKTMRKEMASTMMPIVQKAYIQGRWTQECIEDIKPFILKCLYLGWMMKVQSPPMVFQQCQKEAMFDKNIYKEFTTSGSTVSFLVWPALLLHENGPLVCKGVAQCKKSH